MENVIIVGCNGSIASNLANYFYGTYHTIGISHSEKNCEVDDFFACDVTKIQQTEEVFTKIANSYSSLKGIIYCSGVTLPDAADEMPLANWDTSIAINLTGYFLVIKHLYNLIIKSPGCSIIQLNSKTGKKGSFKNSAYAASKFGGIGLTQSLALELAPYKVRVNAICPGNVFASNTWTKNLFQNYARTQNLTPEQVKEKYISKVPLKRECLYADINNMVEFLLSDKSGYISGQSIVVDGGQVMI